MRTSAARAACTASPAGWPAGSAPPGSSTRCSTSSPSSASRSGAGLAGLIPIPEIQYLAYLHNAEDQLRGEAATLSFFSQGRFRNPMVLRLAGSGLPEGIRRALPQRQRVGVLRDIPGLVVACPARGDDAAAMLRTCVAAAAVDGTVSVFLEPIALYHTRDLHAPGDGGWLAARSRRASAARPRPGLPRRPGPDHDHVRQRGADVSAGRAPAGREQASGADVCDLRWLAPLPVDDILVAAAASRPGAGGRRDPQRRGRRGRDHRAGRARFPGPMARVAEQDTFVPLGPAAAACAAERGRDREGRHAAWPEEEPMMTGIATPWTCCRSTIC